MKYSLLTTSVLAGVLALGPAYAAQNATTDANTAAQAPARTDSNSADVPGSAQKQAAGDTIRRDAGAMATPAANASQQSAASLVEHVNLARLAVALKDKAEAQKHIDEAQKVVSSLTGETRTERVQAGRFTYEYNKASEDYYYPIAGGMVEQKEISTGPFWSDRKGVAVKNAQAAYVTLEIDPEDVNENLADAKEALTRDEFDKAGRELKDLVDDAVKVENAQSLPLVKAQDNLALTRYFIRAKNYDGARYSLKHAESAINDLDRDDAYNQYDQRIAAMKKDVTQLSATLDKRDPKALDRAEAKVSEWWTELKEWSKEKL